MTDPAEPPSQSLTWSGRIADRYACQLSAELVQWFDQNQSLNPALVDRSTTPESGGIEFNVPGEPASLLTELPESIWPGLMNANLLPLVSNGAGDWLCGWMGSDNRISRIVHWYHGGGDWIPWGSGLSEAIAFDYFQHRLPGVRRRHAIPAAGRDAKQVGPTDPIVAWALSNLPTTIVMDDVASSMIDFGIAEVAVRCEMIQHALGFSSQLSPSRRLAEQLGIDANELGRWLFDRSLIPPHQKDDVYQAVNSDSPRLKTWFDQDWSLAEAHAAAVTRIAPDLAWGWDIAGYAAQKRGDTAAAKQRYLCGSECTGFSDQSVRLQTHWAVEKAGKFSVAMLSESFPDCIAQSEYLTKVCSADHATRSDEVSAYWMARGDEAFGGGRYDDAHRYFVAAGWDLGMRPITAYADLLGRIAEAAARSGQFARAALARVHRECLQDRYGASA